MKSVESNDIAAQRSYLARQTAKTSMYPSIEGYQSLIDLAVMTKNMDIAEQLKEEATLLFPQHVFQPDMME
ncbi:hypothetical protein [Enterovibrio coralii]|uniref:hypothetical protein n=1 Tax=Enterovibrio coralii TaxID=294935 RepID=UPI000B2C747F|nr:hypothetical protein [Enterovibrio coralii]